MGSLLRTERPRHAGGISPMQGYGSLSNLAEYDSQWTSPGWNPAGKTMLAGLDDPHFSVPSPDLLGSNSYGSDARSKSKSYKSQGRLHKRLGPGPTAPQRRSTASSTPDSIAHDDFPHDSPQLPSDADLDSSQRAPPLSTRTRAEHVRKNLRWLTQPRDLARSSAGNLRDEIDLSRTAAENEQRSGLGIAIPTSSRPRDSPVPPDDTYSLGAGPTILSHARSTSHNSTSSQTTTTSFKPTMPFVHPIHQQSPRPGMPNRSSASFGSEPSSDILTRPRGESAASAFQARPRGESSASGFTTRTRDASDASAQRPPLKLNTSNTSSARGSASATPTLRSRRGTNMSNMSRPEISTPDLMSPSSRTSMDRALSFIRRDTDPVDPAARAASIQAARQAFQEREDAKARKYERQETKAAERREQVAVKIEDRQRRKSDAAARKQALEAEKRRRQSEAAAFAERIRTNSSAINEKVISGSGQTSEMPAEVEIKVKVKEAKSKAGRNMKRREQAERPFESAAPTYSAEDVQFPRVSRKRAAKSGYLRFWTWFKTRLLRIGQAKRRA